MEEQTVLEQQRTALQEHGRSTLVLHDSLAHRFSTQRAVAKKFAEELGAKLSEVDSMWGMIRFELRLHSSGHIDALTVEKEGGV